MGAAGLAWANYRDAPAGSTERCGTCSYYGAGTNGQCGMFDAPVESAYVCDEYAVGLRPTPDDPMPYNIAEGRELTLDQAAFAVARTLGLVAAGPTVADHNHLIVRGYKRADALESKLAAVIEPILRKAGDEAARNFAARATHHLTAAAPPGWTAPAPDEIINVKALVQTLRTKTDPVRLAVVQSVMTPALEGAGLAFDVTNPLTAKVLAQSGSQVTSIAETTQLNVMRAIHHAYDEGLSIPDTATAIKAGMASASTARATLIARTELAGAVNGGSLAATQIVGQATGTDYFKQWLTAPGAAYPRHEDYDGLDGQTVRLDDLFDVGGDMLQYPGDPDGSPEEVCNCRCTMAYTDDPGELTDVAGGVDSGGAGAVGGEEGDLGAEGEGEVTGDESLYAGPEEDVPAMSKDDAVAYYYTPKSFALNGALRADEPLTAEQEGVRRALDASFVPADKDMVLYRGVTDATEVFGTAKPAEKSALEDKGYMSVSASPAYADDFASGAAFGDQHPVVMRIVVPKGTPILEVPPGEYNYEGSKEFILPRGTNLQVNSFEGRAVTADQIDAGAKTPVVNTSVIPQEPALGPVSSDPYVASLQAELVSINNKLANIDWYIRKGQEGPQHAGRRSALVQRQAEVKRLIERSDRAAEEADLKAALDSARYDLRAEPRDPYLKERVKLMEARQDALAKIPVPVVIPPVEIDATVYRDSLIKERDSAGNKIANLVWKEKNNPNWNADDQARLNALRQHQTNLKNLLASGADHAEERRLIAEELQYSRTEPYASQSSSPHYVKLLEARLKQLDDLAAAASETAVDPELAAALDEAVAAAIKEAEVDGYLLSAAERAQAKEYAREVAAFFRDQEGGRTLAWPTEPEGMRPDVAHFIGLQVGRAVRDLSAKAALAAPRAEVTLTGKLAEDLAAIKSRAEWPTKQEITSGALRGEGKFVGKNGTAPFQRDQVATVLEAGARLDEELKIDPALQSEYDRAKHAFDFYGRGEPVEIQVAASQHKEANDAFLLLRTQKLNEVARTKYGNNSFYNLTGDQQAEAIKIVNADPEVEAARAPLADLASQLRAFRDEYYEAKRKAKEAVDEAGNRMMVAHREKLLSTLGDVRQMGQGYSAQQKIRWYPAARNPTGYRKAQGLLTEATKFMPRDWIERSRPITAGTASRGWHSSYGGRAEIKISSNDKGLVKADAPGLSTAIHEFGHEVEDTNPDIVRLERAFYEYRTRGGDWDGPQEPIGRLSKLIPGSGYGRDEVARCDKFADCYMGKDYGGRNFEILTMGLEAVWSGSYEIDTETRQFILGLLAIL